LQVDQILKKVHAKNRVKATGRFIQNEQSGLVSDCQQKGEFGSHPGREVLDALLAAEREVYFRSLRKLRVPCRVELRGESDRIIDTHPLLENRWIRDVADVLDLISERDSRDPID